MLAKRPNSPYPDLLYCATFNAAWPAVGKKWVEKFPDSKSLQAAVKSYATGPYSKGI